MPRNTLEIKFGQMSPYAKRDINIIASQHLAEWSVLNDLRQALGLPGNYTTLENNHVVLDGTMQEFPDDTDNKVWGVFSENLSDMVGNFQEPPELIITFSDFQKSPGLSFFFYPFTNDYVTRVYVRWYRDELGTNLITDGEFELEGGVIGQFAHSVDGYRRISVKYLSTNNPFRFVKMFAIEFGITRHIEDKEIDELKILEEIDATSETISTNTMRATIRTLNSIFSPLTSPEHDTMMMEHQMLEVYQSGKPFGIFFLEEWEDVTQDGIVFDITAGDAMSMLDRYEFLGGIYINKLVKELLDEIFNICFPTKTIIYILDVEFENSVVTGYLPICSCGEALQHIAFALHATVDTSRTGHVQIYAREEDDIKGTSVVTANSEQEWGVAANLRTHQRPTFFASLEQNYTLLDGSLDEFPDDIAGLNLGWVSEYMSDENGEFNNPPIVSIRYRTTHHFRKVYLTFGPYENEYIAMFEATFYDELGNIIKTQTYSFDKNPALWEDEVFGFRRIDIKVLKTSHPLRFARIAYMDYGRSFYVPLNRQYHGGRDRPLGLVTSVEVTSHDYQFGSITRELFKGYLALGRQEIRFTQPMHDLVVTSGATIIEHHVNYAVLNVVNSNIEISLSGREYINNMLTHSTTMDFVSGAIGETKRYGGYTLVSADIALGISQKIFDHFQSRILSEVRCTLDDLEVGYVAEFETRRRSVVGVIRSMEINLRASICVLEVVGYAVAESNNR